MSSKQSKFAGLIVTAALGFGSAVVGGMQGPFVAYDVDRATGEIYFGGGPAHSQSVLARSPNGKMRTLLILEHGTVTGVSVAPAGGRIAVQERVLKFGVPRAQANFIARRQAGELPGFERTMLWLLSSDGRQLGRVDQARSFSWRAAGDKIAVITGDYVSQYDDPKTTGLWVFDIESRKPRRITQGATHVAWARFDDHVYIWDTTVPGEAKVIRYNASTETMEPTAFQSIYFSPSGDYYFKPDGVAGLPGVFLRQGNLNITSQSRVFADIAAFNPRMWAPDSDTLMLTARRRSDGAAIRILYNAVQDSAVVIQDDGVVGWGRNSEEVLLATDETVSYRRVSDLRVK